MNSLDGRVALITGAARGMGRAHAVKLAGEGADVIAVDICADFPSTDYPGSTADDLAETGRLVESHGRRILVGRVDVRDGEAMRAVVAEDCVSSVASTSWSRMPASSGSPTAKTVSRRSATSWT